MPHLDKNTSDNFLQMVALSDFITQFSNNFHNNQQEIALLSLSFQPPVHYRTRVC